MWLHYLLPADKRRRYEVRFVETRTFWMRDYNHTIVTCIVCITCLPADKRHRHHQTSVQHDRKAFCNIPILSSCSHPNPNTSTSPDPKPENLEGHGSDHLPLKGCEERIDMVVTKYPHSEGNPIKLKPASILIRSDASTSYFSQLFRRWR